MADDADNAMTYIEQELEMSIARARKTLPKVTKGICQNCGEISTTLRNMTCTDCRAELEQLAGRFAGY